MGLYFHDVVNDTLTEIASKVVAGGPGGTTDYNDLTNKPQVNGNTLQGNMTGDSLHLLDENDELTPAQVNTLIGLL